MYDSLIEGLIDNGLDDAAPANFNETLSVLYRTRQAGPVRLCQVSRHA